MTDQAEHWADLEALEAEAAKQAEAAEYWAANNSGGNSGSAQYAKRIMLLAEQAANAAAKYRADLYADLYADLEAKAEAAKYRAEALAADLEALAANVAAAADNWADLEAKAAELRAANWADLAKRADLEADHWDYYADLALAKEKAAEYRAAALEALAKL